MTLRRGLSINRKLPLLITGLLLAVIAAGTWATYREVRRTALDSSMSRLQRAAEQLAGILDQSVANRMTRIGGIGSNPGVQQALAGGNPSGADSALRSLQTGDDSLAIVLRDRSGRLLTQVGNYPAGWSLTEGADPGLPRPDSLRGGASEIFTVAGKPYLWFVAPVSAGDLQGWVTHLQDIGEPGASDRVGDLFGPEFVIYYVNRAGGPWIDLDGNVLDAPFANPVEPPQTYVRAGDDPEDAVAFVAPSRSTPIAIVAESPVSEVLREPRSFLKRLLIGAAIATLLATILGWLLSRSIATPLRQLADAAREVSTGRHPRAVAVNRSDELGALAEAFNRMAENIQASQAALQVKVEEARRARADAETANRAKSDFLATMSHEIRTPINAIIGYTDLLRLGVPEKVTEGQLRQLERIYASGQYLIRLIDEVLDLSRIEAGRMAVVAEVGDADAAIDAAMGVVAPAAAARGVELTHTVAARKGIQFLGDPQRVAQILNNLLSNAIKFTPAGGQVRLGVEADEERGSVCFSVADTGVGISADQMERIFEPFVQADQSYTRSHPGVGLGLAISRELARMMDGEIIVESTPGKGSCFSLCLPDVASADPRAA